MVRKLPARARSTRDASTSVSSLLVAPLPLATWLPLLGDPRSASCGAAGLMPRGGEAARRSAPLPLPAGSSLWALNAACCSAIRCIISCWRCFARCLRSSDASAPCAPSTLSRLRGCCPQQRPWAPACGGEWQVAMQPSRPALGGLPAGWHLQRVCICCSVGMMCSTQPSRSLAMPGSSDCSRLRPPGVQTGSAPAIMEHMLLWLLSCPSPGSFSCCFRVSASRCTATNTSS
mmetsp:Transcript_47734/g.119524  ORF Transcript_47734/g.119524 Transcript_47734/m.119524 type:complete len:232 (+) Transcript_47734:1127-1822(+)